MFRRPSKTTNLRTVLGKALKAEKLQEALDLYKTRLAELIPI